MPTPHDIVLYENRIKQMLPLFPFYISEYMKFLNNTGASVTTRLGYLHEFKHFFEWLWEQHDLKNKYSSISEIDYIELENLSLQTTYNYIENFRDELIEVKKGIMKQRSKASVNHNISALKSLFNYLTTRTEKDNGECYFYRNVMQKVKIEKEKKTAKKRADSISKDLLEEGQLTEFIDFIRNEYENTLPLTSKKTISTFKKNKERDIAIISLFLGSGLRISELASIEVSLIDFKSNDIEVVRKGDLEDSVDVLPLAMDDIRDYLAVRSQRYKIPDDYPYLFVSDYGKEVKPLSVRTIQNLVKTYSKAFRGKPMSPHKLRHTYATDYLRNGGNLVALRDQLGHSSMETTGKYTNLSNKDRKLIVNRMNDKRLGIEEKN
jgi:integrase